MNTADTTYNPAQFSADDLIVALLAPILTSDNTVEVPFGVVVLFSSTFCSSLYSALNGTSTVGCTPFIEHLFLFLIHSFDLVFLCKFLVLFFIQ